MFSYQDLTVITAFSRVCQREGIPRDMEVEVLQYYNGIVNHKLLSLYCDYGFGSCIIKTYRKNTFNDDDQKSVVDECLNFIIKKGDSITINVSDEVTVYSSDKPTHRSKLKEIKDRLFYGKELNLDLLEIYTRVNDRRTCFMFMLIPYEN